MNYYRRFPGDYARDTKHLSMLEHGAYNMLLDALYSTEKPLPNNDALLFRICGAFTKREKKAVKSVLLEFFSEKPTGFTHKKFEKEINHSLSRINAAKENGKQGGRPPKEKPTANPEHNPQESSPAPDFSSRGSRHNFSIPQARTSLALTETENYSRAQFEVFWIDYPEVARMDKTEALREFLSLSVLDQNLAAESVKPWTKCERWQEPRYVPSPVSFIRKRRWECIPKEKPKGVNLYEQGKALERKYGVS